VVESIRTGEAKGYEHGNATKPKTEADLRCDRLTLALEAAASENLALKNRIIELELKVQQLEGVAKPRQALAGALMTDSIVNGGN
jgi:hypothetical protein